MKIASDINSSLFRFQSINHQNTGRLELLCSHSHEGRPTECHPPPLSVKFRLNQSVASRVTVPPPGAGRRQSAVDTGAGHPGESLGHVQLNVTRLAPSSMLSRTAVLLLNLPYCGRLNFTVRAQNSGVWWGRGGGGDREAQARRRASQTKCSNICSICGCAA